MTDCAHDYRNPKLGHVKISKTLKIIIAYCPKCSAKIGRRMDDGSEAKANARVAG